MGASAEEWAATHRFTPVLTRQGEPHSVCVECSRALEPWGDQAGARLQVRGARDWEALVGIARARAIDRGRVWAERIRERLYLTGGRPTNQGPHDDPKHSYSLIS